MPSEQGKKRIVYVAMSGGVDSSVSAALLRDQGYDVTGVYFKTYKPNGDRTYCRQQGMDAQKVCEQLGIPFLVFDLQDDYKREVFDYMIREYSNGRTPNPDMLCNARIKFGVFAQKARDEGADLIATGHYAQTRIRPDGRTELIKSHDENKDQTYFLSQLSQAQLSHTLFPIGGMHKPDVRKRAATYKLHTADKKDSQGICFIGQEIDVKDFLRTYVPHASGDVCDTSGTVIGRHDGSVLYTIGEHHGFTINPQYQTPHMERLYVIDKDITKNTITVGTKDAFEKQQSKALLLQLTHINWINESPTAGVSYTCRIRHRGALYSCTLAVTSQNTWRVIFEKPPYAPAAGQFVAVYDGNVCLGGGVIQSE